MNILYIGAGFVGSCSAAVSADSGHNVLVFDIDEQKISKLGSGDRELIEQCLFEEGLAELLIRHKDRIRFTSTYAEVGSFLNDCDAVFMCLPTPEIDQTGESDLAYYNKAALQLAGALAKRNRGAQTHYVVLVNKSTVPVEMVDHTKKIMDEAGVKNYGTVSNPEFLVEGKAIAGSLKPDRIVVGAWDEKDFAAMRILYQRFYDAPDVSYIEVNPKEAAAGKLLANFYLFNKLSVCFDVIGRTCEAFDGVKFEHIRKILISDKRISSWGFYDSLYAGGSCFIKDARSLAHQLQTAGANAELVNETYLANKRQLERFMGRAEREAQFNWADKTIALVGAAFKRDTNDIRNSPSIEIMNFVLERNIKTVQVYDPAALPMFSVEFPASEQVVYVQHEYEAIKDADLIIIATDWPQFRGLADVVSGLEKRPLIMDGRRMLQHRYKELQEAGFDIVAVGSPFIKAKQ